MDKVEPTSPNVSPDIPAELWMLWNGRGWVCSIDDAREGATYLVAFSEGEARNAAKHQEENYYIECVPVRVK